MGSSANKFIVNRKNQHAITNKRVVQILSYVVECYRILTLTGTTYSKSKVRVDGTVMFEDHLKFEFIDNFLIPNKHKLTAKISELEEINFASETQQRYVDAVDGKTKPDKIDVYINKLGLTNIWKDYDENIYLAIECKRISNPSDCKDYVNDIVKYCNRAHLKTRLPFEAQLAFIENDKLTHLEVGKQINKELTASTVIDTVEKLKNVKLHTTVDGTYLSKHKRNFGVKDAFSIYHLLFDYSKLVVS